MIESLVPVTFDQDDPRERGRAHGELWRQEIRALASLRVELCLGQPGVRDLAHLDALAASHLPVLAQTLPALSAELLGIAEGADLSPARIVVLNHHMGLCGIAASSVSTTIPEGDGGTAMYIAGPAGPVLGQTWDTNASAAPFVRVIRVAPRGGDVEHVCLTLTGCLGVAGIGRTGVAVTVNGLATTDARIGLVGPAVLRTLIAAHDAGAAYARLGALPRSSGNHYMIADGAAFHGVETTGELCVLTQLGPKAAHIHTNHCFDPVLRSREQLARGSASHHRLDSATTLYLQQRPRDVDGLWRMLGSHDGHPRSICSHLDLERGDLAAPRTCARVAFDLWSGCMRVAAGCSADDRPQVITLGEFVSRRPPAA